MACAEPWRQILAEHVKEQGSLVHVLLVNEHLPTNYRQNQWWRPHVVKNCIAHLRIVMQS